MATMPDTVLFAYGLSSALFVLINKSILQEYRCSRCLLTFQQTIVTIGYMLLNQYRSEYIGLSAKRPEELKLSRRWFGIHWPFQIVTLKESLPVAVAFIIMIWANNLCLSNATVGSYMVAKSSCLPFNILLSKMFVPNYKISVVSFTGCALVSLSVIVSANTLRCDSRSLAAGLLSALAQAAFMILSSNIARGNGETPRIQPISLMGHYTFLSTLFLWFTLLYQKRGLPECSYRVLFKVILSGILNIVVGCCAITSLKNKDPVTVNIVGYIKSAFQLMLAYVILKETVYYKEILSVIMTLVGGSLFSFGCLRTKVK